MIVREVSILASVVPEVVRYYSRIGLIKPKTNKKILSHATSGTSPCPIVREIVEA